MPSVGLLAKADDLAKRLISIAKACDAISVANPIRGILQYQRARWDQRAIAPQVSNVLRESLGAMSSSVEGAPGIMVGYLQTLSLGQSMTATLQVQGLWQRVTGTLDTKAAFLVASVGIYLSVVSLVISVAFGSASLTPTSVPATDTAPLTVTQGITDSVVRRALHDSVAPLRDSIAALRAFAGRQGAPLTQGAAATVVGTNVIGGKKQGSARVRPN
jgi:hypothetical protein